MPADNRPVDDLLMEWRNSKVRREQDIAKAILALSDAIFRKPGALVLPQSFLTRDQEITLPNFLQLLAGANITFADDEIAKTRTMSASGGVEAGFLNELRANRLFYYAVAKGSALPDDVGALHTSVGTTTAIYPSISSPPAINIQAAAILNSFSSLLYSAVNSAAVIGSQLRPYAVFRFSLPNGNEGNVRIFVGLANDINGGGIAMLASDSPASNHFAGFRFSTTDDATQWKAICKGSGSISSAGTGVAPSSAALTGEIIFNGTGPTDITFKLNGTVVATLNTNLPAGLMDPMFAIQTLEAVVKNLRWYYEAALFDA